MPFYGNPNVTITAIDVSGGIVLSRTSGNTPCFVQVSASAVTATGTSKPYEDLEFSWDFGDPSGTEVFTNPGALGGTVNMNSGQIAPEAAYVYRSAGTYTVTLTVRGLNGTSAIVTATKTATVTVSDTSGWTIAYADSNAGGTNAGTLANPYNTLTAINTFIGTGNNKVLHVAKGSTFTGRLGPWENTAVSVSGLRIDTYGSGASPIFQTTSGTGNALGLQNSTPSAKSDLVISGITFSASGTATCPEVVKIQCPTGKTLDHVYLDNVTIVSTLTGTSHNNLSVTSADKAGHNKFGVWAGTNTMPVSVGSAAQNIGSFSWVNDWCFYVACSFVGGTGSADTIYEHHIYPDVHNHGLFAYNTFGSGPNRNFCINLNWAGGSIGTPETPGYISICHNDMTGTQRAHDAGNANNDPTLTQFSNLVCHHNKIHDLTLNGCIPFSCVISYTFRDNLVYNNNGGPFYAPDPLLAGLLTTTAYRNKFFNSSSALNQQISYNVTATWTTKQVWTDNIFQDDRTTAKVFKMKFSDLSSAGSVFNRNQYWKTGASNATVFFDDNGTTKTFAQWQNPGGYDSLGRVKDPAWSSPSTGSMSNQARVIW